MWVCGGFDLSERDVAKPDYMDIRSDGLKRWAHPIPRMGCVNRIPVKKKKKITLISHLFR